jgi:phosphoglucosamine mutase
MDLGSLTASRKLFGTDGVRGRVGELLDAELAVSLGRAAAAETAVERPQVVIVRDTRESGPMLESALAAGIAAAGGDAYLAGVLPTPAASILVRRHRFDLAAVVSASHNPWHDNGIKFFGADGIKLDDAIEAGIEERLSGSGEAAAPARSEVGRIRALNGALDDYLRELRSTFEIDLGGHKVLLDCANGATYRAAPAAFERLGASVETLADEPDGRNINHGCGAIHPERLARGILEADADIGFAFDGDGDRVLAVDRRGRIRDGDEIVALIATHLQRAGGLDGGVVVTVMTNFGFHAAMAESGIEVATTKVGDRYVIEELRNRGWEIGGEQSGHVIWMEFTPTGDGIAAALLLELALEGADLADAAPFEKLPQRLVNLELSSREALDGATRLWEAVEAQQAGLEGRGRVLVRPSGTEPVVRLMVEAPSIEECDAVLERLTEVASRELS